MSDVTVLKPQKGAQERFLANSADICIYGGAAGGGKSFSLLLNPLRYKNVDGYGAVIFRKNANQVFSEGGLWDESLKMYAGIHGAEMRKGLAQWAFHIDGGGVSKVTFSHIERDEDLAKWQGSQICCIEFDELTHFTKNQFFYMLSRNRSVCGVKPYIRGSCNPDADSWVAEFISWWIDQDTGYPIPERSGKKRWMMRRGAEIIWADTKQELIDRFHLDTEEERSEPKSVSFVASTIYDNQILLKTNPDYLANLKALSTVERERLLMGNWKIKPAAGLYFKREQVGDFITIIPSDVVRWVRCWDFAATVEKDGNNPDYTAGVLLGKRQNGRYIVADVKNVRMEAADVRNLVKHTAQQDNARFKRVRIRIPQDPAQAGKDQAQSYIKFMSGFDITAVRETGSKEARAEPCAAQWQAGNFDVVVGDWNEMFFDQLESFPQSSHKDMVDALSNGFAELEKAFDIRALL